MIAEMTMPHCLAINGGSSSLKFALFRAADAHRILAGTLDRIGHAGGNLTLRFENGEKQQRPAETATHADGVRLVKEALSAAGVAIELAGVGHRIVHGGPRFTAPTRMSQEILTELRRLCPFAPEHLPAQISLLETFERELPGVPQVACFDTGFHASPPRVAHLLPIPRRFDARGIRRYGFHGISYAFLMEKLAVVAGAASARGRVVLAHLGNGASLAAVRDGKSIDTTMSFTPTAGVPMSTRSGDLDPGLVAYFAREHGMAPEAFHKMVNKESGLLGVSGTSSDVRDLLAAEATDVRAREALDLFCYQVRKTIAAFAGALEGIDHLVFAGGIGENAAPIRARIAEPLAFLGLRLDAERNGRRGEERISADGSPVSVWVLATDEEQMIARHVRDVLGLGLGLGLGMDHSNP